MCNATTNGDRQNSCELLFQPKNLRMGNFNLNVNPQTAAYDSAKICITNVFVVQVFILQEYSFNDSVSITCDNI